MSASIRAVAQQSGLPMSTVASVLTHRENVTHEQVEQIMAAARAVGYPLEGPQARMTHNLGVLFVDESNSGLTHPFFASMLNAFKAEAEAHGYDITFINRNIGLDSATYLEHCRYRHVDGVCLACLRFDDKDVQELLESDIPCVTVDHVMPGQPGVISDNVSGVKMLVDYAVSLGHKRIAFIHGQRNSRVTDDRIRAFRETMLAHGLPVPANYVIEGRYDDLELTRTLVDSMVRRPDRPTCLLLPDDSSYLGAQEAIRENELRIPADISVAGYDGIRLTQSLRPHLTTILQDSVEMGREAALRLIDKIEHPASATNAPVTIPVTLLKGETVGWCNNW